MDLTRAIESWGTPGFRDVLKKEIERLDTDAFPLQQALTQGNFLPDDKPTIVINGIDELEDIIVVRVGLFFSGIDTGSCCTDDPTPVQPHCEYCVIRLEIERVTGEGRVTLLET
jgi:hypothetical protein